MIVAQIVKEPISTKGSRLTAEISLAGRNIVLLPFASKVSISQKIAGKEEKRRLETLVKSILPKNYGAIIRTAAEGKNAATLVGETESLIEKWEGSWKKIASDKTVQLLFTEYSKTTTVLRDLLNESFSNIWINDERVAEEARKYVSLISPEQEKIVHLYEGKQPIFDHFEVTRQIKGSFGKVVPMRQGAYLVIETTEALNVIDVNSGIRTKTSIDMESNDHKNALHKYMQELMENDRAKHNVLPLTKFGLMQITRQRIRPVTEINTSEQCPVCHGTGKIHSSVVIDEEIERKIAFYVIEKGVRSLTLKTSPILGAYLKRGLFNSFLTKWRKRYKVKLELQEVTEFSVLQNELFNEKGDKLE